MAHKVDGDLSLQVRMIEDIYNLMNRIEYYESVANNESYEQKKREVAAKQMGFLQQDLEDYKEFMRNRKSRITKIVYYKYIEGFTLDEVAEQIGFHPNTVKAIHPMFTQYLKSEGIKL